MKLSKLEEYLRSEIEGLQENLEKVITWLNDAKEMYPITDADSDDLKIFHEWSDAVTRQIVFVDFSINGMLAKISVSDTSSRCYTEQFNQTPEKRHKPTLKIVVTKDEINDRYEVFDGKKWIVLVDSEGLKAND
jgi:hypothetical protein